MRLGGLALVLAALVAAAGAPGASARSPSPVPYYCCLSGGGSCQKPAGNATAKCGGAGVNAKALPPRR